jgi:hypothetical protein
VTCRNGLPHSGSPSFADTEEDGGSTPPAPTTLVLTSTFAGSTSPRSSTAVNQRVPSQPAVPHSGRRALNCAQACCRLGGVDLPSEQVRRSEEHRLPHARLATCSCAALRKATTPASACCSCQPRSPGGDVVPCCLRWPSRRDAANLLNHRAGPLPRHQPVGRRGPGHLAPLGRPCPVTPADLRRFAKAKDHQRAALHARIRTLASALPTRGRVSRRWGDRCGIGRSGTVGWSRAASPLGRGGVDHPPARE